MSLVIRTLTGESLSAALDDVARLRLTVFRDFPYLYDGDEDYERRYLETYRTSSRAILVGAFDGTRLVGASTGTPLCDHDDAFVSPVARAGLPVDKTFYCAESVLLPDYRGRGAGHAFFEAREAHAAKTGLTHSCFCAVIRSPDHPARPVDHRELDPFWRARGYRPIDGAVARYGWREIGDPQETLHELQFWVRELARHARRL